MTATTIVQSKHPVTVYHYSRGSPGAPPGKSHAGHREHQHQGHNQKPRLSDEWHSNDSVFRLYAREIGEVPLLSAEEEERLAMRIKHGDEAARERMIKANLRLVVKIAHDFEGYGMPLLDLISEGNIGLMRAVERFDPRRGAKLSTYAAFYIKQAMRRSIADNARLIRLPVYAQEKLMEIHRAETKLHNELGHAPSDDEIGAEINYPSTKISKLRSAAVLPTSLDIPLDEEGTCHVSELVADERATIPDESLKHDDTVQTMVEMMKHLPERERDILNRRFGFLDGSEKTLEEIGTELGLTRERIRQLQNSALRRLRQRIEARNRTHHHVSPVNLSAFKKHKPYKRNYAR